MHDLSKPFDPRPIMLSVGAEPFGSDTGAIGVEPARGPTEEELMNEAFTTEATTTAPPEQVWALLTDWQRAPEWMAGIDRVEAEGPTTAGTPLLFAARGATRRSEIVAAEAPRSLVVRSSQGPVTADYRYELEPTEGGGTTIRLRASCELSGVAAITGPAMRRSLRRTDGGQPEALARLADG